MRQTHTSTKNVSEHVTNDLWTEATCVTCSEERTGTTSFQIVREELQGYKRVHGTHKKIQETTRPDSMWPGAWIRFSMKQKLAVSFINYYFAGDLSPLLS